MRVIMLSAVLALAAISAQASSKEDGYRGVWYFNQPSNDQYVYKYSGGLGTYTEKHIPLAIYAPRVDKTFFVYGGTREVDREGIMIMAGYYDHKTGMVPKPTLIWDKPVKEKDAHHNPVLSIDKDGYIWVFAPSHGRADACIFRSEKPYSIDGFKKIVDKEMSYPQPWYFDGFGFMLLFTKYTAGRELYLSTSPDGVHWSDDRKLVGFAGHYQVNWVQGTKRGTAFNWHPPGQGLNFRTNLYYLETDDFGKTWHNSAGRELALPLSEPHNDALVRDYQKEGLLVYEKDLNFDKDGHPIILYITSKGYASGPANAPYTWTIAHWTGRQWDYRRITESDHNYDSGSIYVESDGTWRVIGPSEPGPQKYATGGEVVIWTSGDQGRTWRRLRQVTANSRYNHAYPRKPVNAHPDFYSFWADGGAFKPSESRLYFTNKTGDKLWMLPDKMTHDFEKPTLVKVPK